MVSPPGPVFQKLNAIIHSEPYASIIYFFYWSILLQICTPFVIIFLCVQTIWKLITLYAGRSGNAPLFDPKNKPDYDMAVVVTGCDSGFGKDIAIYAADAGYTVFAGCYNHDTSKKQFETSPKIKSFPLDVTKNEDVGKASNIVLEWLNEKSIPVVDIGRKRVLHAIINNAGIGTPTLTDWCDVAKYQAMMDVNYFGIIRMMKSFLPILKDQAISESFSGMRIINIISAAGFSFKLGSSSYSASKHAAQSYTESLRTELNPFKIAVSSVNPSFHATPMVTALAEGSKAMFDNLPPDIQSQYGTSFFENYRKGSDHILVWDSAVVIEQVLEKCLKAKHPPRQLIIGFDARFVIITIFKLLPPNIRDSLLQIVAPTPIPEMMK